MLAAATVMLADIFTTLLGMKTLLTEICVHCSNFAAVRADLKFSPTRLCMCGGGWHGKDYLPGKPV